MLRPATLKPAFYELIMKVTEDLSFIELKDLLKKYGCSTRNYRTHDGLVSLILENPSPFLFFHAALAHKPDLLKETFIQFLDGQPDESIDYYIDGEAAELISQDAQMVILTRIDDGKEFGVPVKRIVEALKCGCSLDYKEKVVLRAGNIQNIIDHFHIGRLESYQNQEGYYELKTKQGIFILFESEPFELHLVKPDALTSMKLERLLLPDYKNELNEYSSYVHYKNKYYSVYKKQ